MRQLLETRGSVENNCRGILANAVNQSFTRYRDTTEIIAFGEIFVLLWQVSCLTDRTPEADQYERQWRSRDPGTLPAVDVWVATYDEERTILEQTILGLKQLDWPSDKLNIFVLDDGQ